MKIALSPDFVRHKNGEEQSFSARWTELAALRGFDTVAVDVDAPDLFKRLQSCDALMWRFGFDPLSLQHAKRLLPAIEHGMSMPVFPSWASCWHFEDKIAQSYLLAAAGLPMPKTWVFWNARAAADFCASATYPMVAKLSSGIQSNNVRLVHDKAQASDLIRSMFGSGLLTMTRPPSVLHSLLGHRLPGLKLLLGKPLPRGTQHGYLYLQEFLSDNAFDTRITVIGNRAFGFRRHNRPGDFRASGSGRIDWQVDAIDIQTIRLAFRVARALSTQSVAIDGLRRGAERLIGEISYTYASWAVRDCPGHWVLSGTPEAGELAWVKGKMRPEDAIFEDFVASLAHRSPLRPKASNRTGTDEHV